MAKAKSNELTFEENLKLVENIVKVLEQRDIPLEESFVAYKQGIDLVKQLESKLDTIEKELIVLNGGETDGI